MYTWSLGYANMNRSLRNTARIVRCHFDDSLSDTYTRILLFRFHSDTTRW